MFKRARTQLTGWYLLIIMSISIFFSLIIYQVTTAELRRIEIRQQQRRPLIEAPFAFAPEVIEETKKRIAFSLFAINGIILCFSAASGYFLAGKTLDPIQKMLDEQKIFVANASHELRTPLTSLKSEIEVALRNKKLKISEAKKLLLSNLEEVNKIQHLSDHLLKLHSYESGKVLSMTKVNLKEIALKGIGKLQVKSDLKKSIIWGNETSLIELVTILLNNAIKYSPKDSEISVTVKEKTLIVKDNGIGIANEDLPHIFDRFYQADSSRNKIKADGYGLGLSIAKSIVSKHKGKIEVTSKPGKGTAFTIKFP